MRRRCPVCHQEVYIEAFDNTAEKCQQCVAKEEEKING